jgi:hypothetical protein
MFFRSWCFVFNLIQFTGKTFIHSFLFTYWIFHFQDFNLVFFRNSITLLNSTFISCIALFPSVLWVLLKFTHMFVYSLISFVILRVIFKNSLSEISSTLLSCYCGGVEFWRCHVALFFLLSALGFALIEFNHFWSFSWSVLRVQEGLCSGGAVSHHWTWSITP